MILRQAILKDHRRGPPNTNTTQATLHSFAKPQQSK